MKNCDFKRVQKTEGIIIRELYCTKCTAATYFIVLRIQHCVVEIVEVDGMVWKELLYAADGVHIDVKIVSIGRRGEDKLGEVFTLVEVVQWESDCGQYRRVAGIEGQFSD